MLDTEVGHDKHHGMAGEDVVPAVDVLPVDGQAAPWQDLDDPVDHQQGRDVARLLRALVARVRLWEDCHEDGDWAVEVQETQ